MDARVRQRVELPDVAILDGGLGTLLAESGHPEINNDPLWGAGLLHSDPDSLRNIHNRFLVSGSDVIETGTYQASLDGLMTHLKISKDKACAVMKAGAKIALDCRDKFWNDHPEVHSSRSFPLVAGSIGPYGACLADGSEYTGNYVTSMTTEDLMEWHQPRIELLIEAGVDILAIDTIPAQKEALALSRLLSEKFPTARAYLSLSCKDSRSTCHGEDVEDVVKSLTSCNQIFGIGFNCTAPENISPLLKRVNQHTKDKILVVFPNSGETWTTDKEWSGSEDSRGVYTYVKEWYDHGARWIGGCCRVRPDDIKSISKALSTIKSNT